MNLSLTDIASTPWHAALAVFLLVLAINYMIRAKGGSGAPSHQTILINAALAGILSGTVSMMGGKGTFSSDDLLDTNPAPF